MLINKKIAQLAQKNTATDVIFWNKSVLDETVRLQFKDIELRGRHVMVMDDSMFDLIR
jgi:hypothetical protein